MDIKVKLTCNWCSDKELFDRFERVYVSEYNKSNISFTDGDIFDYLMIINYPIDNKYNNFPKEKTIGYMGEPSWSAKNFYPVLKQKCEYIFYHNAFGNNIIYYPGMLPMHIDYDKGNNLDFYINNTFDKTKLCSMVVSYSKASLPNTLYNKRVELAEKILKTDMPIDIYGKGWDKSGIIDERIKGPVENKKDGLIDYKFSIGIENSIENGYFTEKITDCILTNTIPIYFGCPNIHQYFPNILTLSSLDNVTELNDILKIDYTFNIDKKLMAVKYNLYTALTKFINRSK